MRHNAFMSISDHTLRDTLANLVEARASDALLAQVIREMVGRTPGAGPAPAPDSPSPSGPPARPVTPAPSRPSLPPIESETSAKPTAAAPPSPKPVTETAPPPAKASPGKSPRAKKQGAKPLAQILPYRDKAKGIRSSISIPADQWEAMLSLEPDMRALRSLLTDLARQAPELGRSQWVVAHAMAQLRAQ